MPSSTLQFDIISLFPEICRVPLGESIIGRAVRDGLIQINFHDLRDWGIGRHKQVDDVPYGGGQGMVLKPEPLFAAIENVAREGSRVVLMTPQGKRFDQATAEKSAREGGHLILVCGHYEGVDHRVVESLIDEEWSIGDYVLTNGAIAATIVVDAIARLLPGVLGDERSAWDETFSGQRDRLEAPHFTRPPEYRSLKVPAVLLSGHHQKIEEWRREASAQRTRQNRPDLCDE